MTTTTSATICWFDIPSTNVEKTKDFIQNSKTMAIHRKKETNTLYTINALNEAIRENNGGMLDKSFPIDWNLYQNSLLLTNDQGLNIVKTKLYKIINC